MSKSKEKFSTRASALQVVGVVYNHNKDDRSLRLIDFLQAGRDFAERYNTTKAEEEEVERLKAENDQRVEELLAKAKSIKQRSTSESENRKDTGPVDESETGDLEQNSKPDAKENGDDVNKTEKPHSKADALERLRRMEWKRCQEDHRDISSNLRSKTGRQEFPPLTKSRNDDEYFSGTKVKKNREKKKNKEEVLMSLEELEKHHSTMPDSEKSSKLGYTVPPRNTSCWQNKAGASLFESTEQKTEDLELNWALRESLREQEEQEKRFMEILAGTHVETQRKPPGVMSFPPPTRDKEEDWDAEESGSDDVEQSIKHSKTEDKNQAEIRGKQRGKGSEQKEARSTMSRTRATSTTTNDKSQDLQDSEEHVVVNGLDHFNSAQQRMNKLATNLSDTLKQKEIQSSNVSRSYAPQYHKKGQAHFNRTYSQHDHSENKGKFEDESGHCMKRVPESSKNKSDTVHRQEDTNKFVKQTTRESLDHGNKSHHVYRNIHNISPTNSNTNNDDLSPKTVSLEHASKQKHISQSDVKNDISQSFSALHIETAPMRAWEEEKLTYQNSAASNVVQPSSQDSLTSSLSSNKVSQFEAKTQGSSTANAMANIHQLTQAKEQQSQQLSGAAVPQSICSPFNAPVVSASAEHHQQQQKQPLPSQSVPSQSLNSDSCIPLLEELQRIRMYQNLLMQLSAQDSLQAALQQQLQSMNASGTSGCALTQEQLQTMLQLQHQQTLMSDLKALLQPQIQNASLYAPVANKLQPQYPGTVLPSAKGTSEHSQAPSISPGSPNDTGMNQRQFQGMLQQQHPGALLHAHLPGTSVTNKELPQQQQWGGISQPGTQTSATVHLSLQTSYPNVSQSGYVGAPQYSQPVLMQQQYASNINVTNPIPPQSLTGAMPNMNPTPSNTVEAPQYSQPMLLQQQCASNVHVARPQLPQRFTGMPSLNPETTNAMSALEATQYPQSMLLQQQYAHIPQSPSPQSPTGMPPNMNPTATNVAVSAVEASQYNMRAQLMAAGMYNQQLVHHAMAGLVPLVPQEKPKSKGRGRLLRDSD